MPRKKATWQLLTIQDIAEFRKQKGFKSDALLAEALEVSVGSIVGWKKGVRAPSLRVQKQLVEKIEEGSRQRSKKRQGPSDTDRLVRRLLALAPEVQDPSALIEAAQRLLVVD